MGHQVTIGGERLGSGNRNKVSLHSYERSTHDLSFVMRTTMASGTLVPFMSEVALPGDTFDIELDGDVLTHPTIGPLFGTYKVEYHLFQVPMRLYQAKLHMNMLGIGLDMSNVALPQLSTAAPKIDRAKIIDNQQINPSCIWSYLGMRGMGHIDEDTVGTRLFNAIPYLGYWDIVKNYYANKQEELGAVIHRAPTASETALESALMENNSNGEDVALEVNTAPPGPYDWQQFQLTPESRIVITTSGLDNAFTIDQLLFRVTGDPSLDANGTLYPAGDVFATWTIIPETNTIIGENPTPDWLPPSAPFNMAWGSINNIPVIIDPVIDTEPKIKTFPLKNIDDMRIAILQHVGDAAFIVNSSSPEPYNLPFQNELVGSDRIYSQLYSQEGLALKTYNSDLFNNWIQTEWIDGENGIAELTKVDTTGDSFKLDELNLKQKIYNMLNRIAISGGTYDDWLDAVYTEKRTRSAENPIYLGGLIQNLVFQEVVSNAASEDQPLGTLAGRGRIGSKRKGGEVVAKIDEPSYIMGIASITPNIDYSQGNKWDVNLATMNDLHKPALDEIGFQDLITDQMAWWDTRVNLGGSIKTYRSAGKQPAWINYMTNVNTVKGNFADQTQQMFMVLNRRYNVKYEGTSGATISDLTTYIDPSKFNHIFADTRRDAQNFWMQIAVKITARRKMSAKVIPNL